MNSPINHHILPEFYLEYFSTNNNVCVYDKKENRYYPSSIKKATRKRHFYSYEDYDKQKNPGPENFLCTIEGLTGTVMKKLDRGDQLSPDDKYSLSAFVASLKYRGESFDSHIRKITEPRIRVMMDSLLLFPPQKAKATQIKDNEAPLLDDDTRAELSKLYYDGKIKIEFHRNQILKTMVELIDDIAPLLWKMDWLFLRPPAGTFFITSDNPFILIPPNEWKSGNMLDGFGLATPGVKKIIPLSKDLCLIILDQGEAMEHGTATDGCVSHINSILVSRANRWVVSHDKKYIESILESVHRDS